MKALAIVIAVGSLFATQAAATIAFGTSGSYNVAWIDRDDPCETAVKISPDNQTPCDRPFTLNNGFTYILRDCETPSFSLWNGDGTYNEIGDVTTRWYECEDVPDVHRDWKF